MFSVDRGRCWGRLSRLCNLEGSVTGIDKALGKRTDKVLGKRIDIVLGKRIEKVLLHCMPEYMPRVSL
jgi:hypothetical protein